MKRIPLCLGVMLLFTSPACAVSQGDACDSGDVDKVFAPEKKDEGSLICDGSVLQYLESAEGNPVRKGIRTITPEATLDVNGEVRIGHTGIACGAALEGSIRYVSTDNEYEFCDGSAWVPFETAGSSCPTTPTTTGLIAHWKLDEMTGTNLTDEMGNYDATYQTTPLPSGGSNTGNSLVVFGTSNNLATAGSISEINGASAVTITGWMKRVDAGDLLWLGKGYGFSNRYLALGPWNDNNAYFSVDNPGSGPRYGYFAQSDTDWHHYALVFDGTLSGNSNRLKGYMDGAAQSLTYGGTIPSTTPSNADSFTIGNNDVDSEGYIDEVRIYNRALSAAEVLAIYNYNAAGCD